MKPSNLLFGLIKLLLVSVAIATVFNALEYTYCVFGVLVALSCVVSLPKGAFYGVIVENWAPYIIERFYKDNTFLRNAYDDSPFAMQGRIIHIPQPGSKPQVQKNRSSFPGAAVRRVDTDVVYALDEYSTDPTHIPNIDAIHLSYSKQDSVLGDHMQTLNDLVADDMLIKWAANAAVVRTTGGAVGPIAGQTGNRKGFVHQDLQKLMIQFNSQGVPAEGRFALINDFMYESFYASLSDTQQRDFSRYNDAENGVIAKIHGFNILRRPTVVAATSAGAVKPLGSALAATDHLCSMAWHKNSVAFAMGDVKLFQDMNNPLYYGDIHSALVMAGGRVRRENGEGIALIMQDASA